MKYIVYVVSKKGKRIAVGTFSTRQAADDYIADQKEIWKDQAPTDFEVDEVE